MENYNHEYTIVLLSREIKRLLEQNDNLANEIFNLLDELKEVRTKLDNSRKQYLSVATREIDSMLQLSDVTRGIEDIERVESNVAKMILKFYNLTPKENA